MPSPARFSLLGCLAAFAIALVPLTSRAGSESELREFLYSLPNTYGWMPTKGSFTYDFFRDGRLHVQGAGGEATMWEGTWKLKGDKLTLIIPDLETTKTFTVRVEEDDLYLNKDRYKRYVP